MDIIKDNREGAYVIPYNYYESQENMVDTKQYLNLSNENECGSAANDPVQINSTIFGVLIAVSDWEACVTIALLSTIIILTIIGNLLVILSVFTYKPLRIVQNFFIVSLAVADLTVALLVLPFNVAYLILGRWEFGITMCKMWLTCDVMCCTSSILNLCVIALDRYWAITDPINYAHKRTMGRVLLLITGVWLLSLLISSPPLVGWNDWPQEFTSTTPCELNSDRGYVIYSSLGSFFIPLLIMTIVYVEIFIATRRRLRARARASRINAMPMRCSKAVGTVEQSDDLSVNESEMKNDWFDFMRCCLNFKTGLRNANMQTDYAESVSSEGRVHNEQKSGQECNKDAETVNEQQLQSDVERLEALMRKKARRPRIKDSIKHVRKTSNKSILKTTTADNTRENAETQENTARLANSQVCIEVYIENEEMTSAFDNENENLSLKISPPQSSGGVAPSLSMPLQKNPVSGGLYQIIEERQRISLSKERRAARTLGIIMGVFVICWLPFSIMYVILPFCKTCCPTNKFKNFVTWLGYINSGLNPVIYTIFNMDYRRAFKRLLGIK